MLKGSDFQSSLGESHLAEDCFYPTAKQSSNAPLLSVVKLTSHMIIDGRDHNSAHDISPLIPK